MQTGDLEDPKPSILQSSIAPEDDGVNPQAPKPEDPQYGARLLSPAISSTTDGEGSEQRPYQIRADKGDEDPIKPVLSAQPNIHLHTTFYENDIKRAREIVSNADLAITGQPLNLDNPLGLVRTFNELHDIIQQFAVSHQLLKHVQVFQLAARFLKNPRRALSAKDILEEAKDPFKKEKTNGFWAQSKSLKCVVILTGTLSGMCQGWSQSILNGTGLDLANYLDLNIQGQDPNVSDLWKFGILQAALPIAAGLLSPLIADPLQSHFLGRRGAIALSSAAMIASVIGAAASTTISQQIGARIVWGMSLGAKASCVAPYLSEISSPHQRGALTSHWQLSDALGIFFGFVSWLIIENTNLSPDGQWRILTLTVLIPAVPLVMVAWAFPESPIYLLKRARYHKAYESACLLRTDDALGAQLVTSSHFQMEAEHKLLVQRRQAKRVRQEAGELSTALGLLEALKAFATGKRGTAKKRRPSETKELRYRLGSLPGSCQGHRPVNGDKDPEKRKKLAHSYHITETGYFGRLGQLFSDARCRRALICSSTVMATQGFLCGINLLAFFSSFYSQNANLSASLAAGLSVSWGACNYLAGLPAYRLSDSVGRVNLMLIGLPIMSVLLLILALVFLLDENNPARPPLIAVFSILFVVAYSPTVGTSPFAISSEVFGAVVRETGMAMSVCANMLSLGILILIFPSLNTAMHGYPASLSLFAIFNLVAFVLVFCFCPETKGRTLDEQSYTFDLPTGLIWKYRIYYAIPELWGHYIRPYYQRNIPTDTEGSMVDNSEGVEEEGWSLLPFYRWARSKLAAELEDWEDGEDGVERQEGLPTGNSKAAETE